MLMHRAGTTNIIVIFNEIKKKDGFFHICFGKFIDVSWTETLIY